MLSINCFFVIVSLRSIEMTVNSYMDNRDFVKLTSALYRVTDLFPHDEPLRFGLRDWALKILNDLTPYHFSISTNLDQETADRVLKSVQTLRCFLEVSQGQRWVDEINLILLDQEYSRLEERVKDVLAFLDDQKNKSETAELPEAKKEELPEPEQEVRSNGPILMEPSKTYTLDDESDSDDSDDSDISDFNSFNNSNGSDAPTERQEKILEMIKKQPRIQMRQIQEKLTDVTSRTLRRDLESLVQQGKVNRIGRGTGTFYQINFGDNS
jgi:hypothetical protein